MKILVVDDDKLNLKVADGYLKTYFPQYEVYLCQQPNLTQKIIEESNIDILLLDIMMPKINGMDILKQLRAQKEYRDLQILMLTAMNDLESFRTCFELGANDYITKPINVAEFQARIKAATNTRSNSMMMYDMYNMIKNQNAELKSTNQRLKNAQGISVQAEKMELIQDLLSFLVNELEIPASISESNLDQVLHSFTGIETDSGYKSSLSSSQVLGLEDLIKCRELIKSSHEGIRNISETFHLIKKVLKQEKYEKEFCLVDRIISNVVSVMDDYLKDITAIKLNDFHSLEVFCYENQFRQIIFNVLLLMTHLMKTGKRGGPFAILIKAYKQEENIIIEFQDNGPGMSEDRISRMFKPFKNMREFISIADIGINTSISIITKEYNGSFNVVSKPGKGTQITIKLPEKLKVRGLYE